MGNMNEVDAKVSGPIGKSVRRREDHRFLTGAGNYTETSMQGRPTVSLRSRNAHARIADRRAAKSRPGVSTSHGADSRGRSAACRAEALSTARTARR